MQKKCINNLDFKTRLNFHIQTISQHVLYRMSLRTTSKCNKYLVDSDTMNFEDFFIFHETRVTTVIFKNEKIGREEQITLIGDGYQKVNVLLRRLLLPGCEIGNLQLDKTTDAMFYDIPVLRVRELGMFDVKIGQWIRRCVVQRMKYFGFINTTRLVTFPFECMYREMIESVEIWSIHSLTQFGIPCAVAAKWNEYEITSEKKLQFSTKSDRVLEFFKFNFENYSLPSSRPDVVRISTHSKSHQIVLKHEQDMGSIKYFTMVFVALNVSREMLEQSLQPDLNRLCSNGVWDYDF
ncbi:hypothetical protein B9Z55_029041 [Caenorhabditis nigoni]|nr:hypothetical protein B9Z55_029041 [Caenorhabditis nigoni]